MTREEWKDIFRNNLADILEEKGISQTQLARETNLSPSRVSDYLKGYATPTIFAIINMAYALDMDVSELVDFDERID